ncbi:MAG TPA: hypothetical protein VD884_08225 [Ohtaekwangia sp.]|nr:hypothetical protein [Ohtaekwangia sp.]
MDVEKPEVEPTPTAVVEELSAALRAKLITQQDPVYAVVGGLSAAILGGVLWAIITVATKYQIGYMAIGVGLICGFAVRYFGAGIQTYFGFIGAFFALLGCVLGNLFSQVGFIADAQSLGYFETITLLNFNLIVDIYVESFSPMDVLFYGIAGYEGYKFAFRDVSEELTRAMEEGSMVAPPYAKYRLPAVIVLFVTLSVGGYLIRTGSTGEKTFYYESGAKRSSGELVDGKENGAWQGWWENGNPQWQGTYLSGTPDSTWKYYREDGILYRITNFKNGVQHGQATDYYPSGNVQAVGSYQMGRQHGPWSYLYENGKPSATGAVLLDLSEGPWETFYENGQLSTKGSYTKGVQAGLWTYWNEDASKTAELEFSEDGNSRILNTWTASGIPEIVNGNGKFRALFPSGQVMESGSVKNGWKVGLWKKNYEDGSRQDEGEFRNKIYYLTSFWSGDGRQMVTNGEGTFESYYPDGSLMETGLIEKGLRFGQWINYQVGSDSLASESTYANGNLEGSYVSYFENGQISMEGMFENNKRVGDWKWYTQDGELDATVSFVDGRKDGPQLFFDGTGSIVRTEIYKDGELIHSKIGPE